MSGASKFSARIPIFCGPGHKLVEVIKPQKKEGRDEKAKAVWLKISTAQVCELAGPGDIDTSSVFITVE
jgi:hypothetical protein